MAAEQVMDTRDITENLKNSLKPNRILLFSGKRKSGKDYITEILHNRYQIYSTNSLMINMMSDIIRRSKFT